MNTITILFFATLKDLIGEKKIEFELEPGTDVAGLKTQLAARFPPVQPALKTVLVSVNKEFAFDQDEIPSGAEVALFPPVSGG